MQFCNEVPIEIRHVVLEQLELANRGVIAPEFYLRSEQARFDIYRDQIGYLFMDLRYRIASSKPSIESYKYPENWREAFKERWFPKWLLKKYPVKYRVIEMSSRVLYPDVEIPEREHVFYYATTRRIERGK